MREDTTIKLKRSTKKLLDTFGKKNETYDQLIRRLIKELTELREKFKVR